MKIFDLKIFGFTLKRHLFSFPLTIGVCACALFMMWAIGSQAESMQEQGLFNQETVAFVNELRDNQAQTLNDIIFSKELSNLLEVTEYNTEAEANELYKQGRVKSVLYAFQEGEEVRLQLATTSENSPLKGIIQNYKEQVNAAVVFSKNGIMMNEGNLDTIEINTLKNSKGKPIGLDYYGVITLFQMVCTLGILSVFSYCEDNKWNIGWRLKTSPIKRKQIVIARIFSCAVFIFLIEVIIAMLSNSLFGVNWNGNITLIAAAMFSFAICTALLGAMLGALTRSTMASVGGLIVIGNMVWAAWAGGFSPYIDYGWIANLSPILHVRTIIFSTIYGGGNELIFQSFIWLVMIMIVEYFVLIMADRRNQRANF